MKIKPLELADFDLVEVKTTNDCNPTPHCKYHGAMNKITSDGVWRCICVAGYELVRVANAIGKKDVDNVCRAGCIENKDI